MMRGLLRTETVGLFLAAVMLLGVRPAAAQVSPWRDAPPDPRRPAVQPDQPVRPQYPTIERRAPQTVPDRTVQPVQPDYGRQAAPNQPPVAQAPPPPFILTPQEQAEVDRVLKLWEQRSAAVTTFSCRFKRWEYDPVFGPANAPRFEDLGEIKYAAPDRGAFQTLQTVQNGKEVDIEPNRAEHWICDGKSIFEYKPQQKQVVAYPLPPELQGKAIANSPLPFLFGAKAEELKRRYFVRLVTPRNMQGQQTWIEARPRFQQDAANFKEAQLILTNQNMQPFGLQMLAPNGKNRTSYQFFEIVLNDPLRFFKGDPFHASVPLNWQKVTQQPQPPQAANRPQTPGTR